MRRMATNDEALFCELYSDANTMRFISRPMSRRQAHLSFHATLQSMQCPEGPRFFSIAEKRGARAIGVCAIQPIEECERRAELGLMLKRDARGRGLGEEILSKVMTLAFQALPIDTVWVQYRPANAAATRLFAGLGFSAQPGVRPRAARRDHRIAFMQRSAWRVTSKPTRGRLHVEHHRFS